MAESTDFKYGMLIKYHFHDEFNGSLHLSIKDYWGIGYVVGITEKHIILSSLDPNKPKREVVLESFRFHNKVRLENIFEFKEVQEPSKSLD